MQPRFATWSVWAGVIIAAYVLILSLSAGVTLHNTLLRTLLVSVPTALVLRYLGPLIYRSFFTPQNPNHSENKNPLAEGLSGGLNVPVARSAMGNNLDVTLDHSDAELFQPFQPPPVDAAATRIINQNSADAADIIRQLNAEE